MGEHRDADVIVVGAGPGGSSAAYHLAQHGHNVLLLEKTEFPREKVCGDGLTPRAVKQLIMMGVDTSSDSGWHRHRGLRVIGGGVRMELDWPELATYPNYGLTRSRIGPRPTPGQAGGGCWRDPYDQYHRSPARS